MTKCICLKLDVCIFARSKLKRSNIILITTQICVWLFIISAFINPNYSSIAIFTYFLYVIIELCSHTSRFLLKKKTTNSIYNKLKELFISSPVLQLSVSCYHLEKRIQENRTVDNITVQNEITERVETYKERRDFPYYSFRDISGLFEFDLNNDNFKNKTYIKLTLDSMISFADSISYYDYQIFKNNFINENIQKDINIDFKEKFYIRYDDGETKVVEGVTVEELKNSKIKFIAKFNSGLV